MLVMMTHERMRCTIYVRLSEYTKFRIDGEISPTRCKNCVFILRNGFTLVAIDTDIDIFRGESFLSASFVIPNGHIRLIQLPLGVLVLVSQFRLLGVDEFNICGSEHHAL